MTTGTLSELPTQGPAETGARGRGGAGTGPRTRARSGWMTGGLASRGRRLLSAAVAIIIGTAFLTTSLAVLATAQAGLENAVAAGVRDADLVATPDSSGLHPEDLDTVAALPGVDQVVPEAMVFVQHGDDHLAGAALPWGGVDVVQGREPEAAGEIAVSRETAGAGITVGDELALTTYGSPEGGPPVTVDVVGVVDPGTMSPISFGQGFLATDAALRELDPMLAYQSLQLHLAGGADQDAVRAALVDALPGATVQTGPEAAQERVDGMTGETAVLSAILLGFGAVALATAAIVIANTFTITLAQRTGELALLRCVGATKAQVRRLVLLEAVLLGLLASVAGVLVGLGLAWGLLVLARRAELGMPLGTGLEVTSLALLLPLVVGTVVTLLAALLPAARATKVSPLAALRPAGPSAERVRIPWLRLGAGILLFALGCALMFHAASARDVLSGVLGGLASFIGVLLATVVLVPTAVRALGLGARLAGVPGRLAVDNAVRNPGRAAATSAALLVGVTLITMTTIGAATGERTAMGEIDDAYAVDLVATAPNEVADDDTTPLSGTIPPDVVARIGAVEGVAHARLVETAYLSLGEQEYPTLTLGLDQDATDVVRSETQLAALTPGTIGLSNHMQAIHGLDPGERIQVTGPGGSRELTIVEMGLGQSLAVSTEDLHALGGDQVGHQSVLLKISDRADLGAAMSGLQEAGGDASLNIEGSAAERAMISQVLDIMVLVATALLGVAVVIAVVGIANTLSLSVIERHREHALLRGLGLTRGQLRSMLLAEGVLLAVVSALIGLGLGLLYAWLGVQTILPGETAVRLNVPWARIGVILGVALLAGVLASVLPARRAARVTPAEGLATA